MDETVGAIKNLANQVHKITQVIDKVADDSNDISKVLEVIGGIAEQTNLLALNAAIESARAVANKEHCRAEAADLIHRYATQK